MDFLSVAKVCFISACCPYLKLLGVEWLDDNEQHIRNDVLESGYDLI